MDFQKRLTIIVMGDSFDLDSFMVILTNILVIMTSIFVC